MDALETIDEQNKFFEDLATLKDYNSNLSEYYVLNWKGLLQEERQGIVWEMARLEEEINRRNEINIY